MTGDRGDMRRYCGGRRDDMLAWITLEAIPQNIVHGNTDVGNLSMSGVGLRNESCNRFRHSLCNSNLVTQVIHMSHEGSVSFNIGNLPGSWKNCNCWPRVVCYAIFSPAILSLCEL